MRPKGRHRGDQGRGITVRYEKRASSKATLPPVNVDLDEAQRFLDLIDPNAKSWTFQTFDDNHERTNTRLAKILHGTLKEHAAELKRLSRYGAGIYVCPNQTDGKGRKRQNIIGIRAVSVDLDGSPLGPVQACEITPHAIIKTSSGRYQAHWRAKGLRLDEFEEVTRGVAALFDGDAQIAELSHTCRLPGFEHAKIPTKRFQVRIVEENERPPYTAAKIRKAFPPVAKPASPTSKTTGASGNPLFMSPAGQRAYDEAKTKADKYILPDGSSPKLAAAEEVVGEAAKLGLLSYELDRRALAESVGIRATVLDDLVSERREEDKGCSIPTARRAMGNGRSTDTTFSTRFTAPPALCLHVQILGAGVLVVEPVRPHSRRLRVQHAPLHPQPWATGAAKQPSSRYSQVCARSRWC